MEFPARLYIGGGSLAPHDDQRATGSPLASLSCADAIEKCLDIELWAGYWSLDQKNPDFPAKLQYPQKSSISTSCRALSWSLRFLDLTKLLVVVARSSCCCQRWVVHMTILEHGAPFFIPCLAKNLTNLIYKFIYISWVYKATTDFVFWAAWSNSKL